MSEPTPLDEAIAAPTPALPPQGFLERERERKRLEAEAQRAADERRRPFDELWTAANAFSHWGYDLHSELGQEPSNEEIIARFIELTEQLRGVVIRHGLTDFWDMFDPEGNEDGFALATGTFRDLLKAEQDQRRKQLAEIFSDPDLRELRHTILWGLPFSLKECATAFNRYREGSEPLTLGRLHTLLGISHHVRPLLRRQYPVLLEFEQELTRRYPNRELIADDLKALRDYIDRDHPPPTWRAAALPLEDLIAWLQNAEWHRDGSGTTTAEETTKATPIPAGSEDETPPTPVAPTPPAGVTTATGDAKKPKKPKKLNQDETNVAVREWFKRNADKVNENPHAVTRDGIADEINAHGPYVSNCPMWVTFREDREKKREPGEVRTVPNGHELLVVLPDAAVNADELAELIDSDHDTKEQDARYRTRNARRNYDGE